MGGLSADRGKLCDDRPVRETFNNQKVRVVIADDHPLFRDGLMRALTGSGLVDVVAEAKDGPSALAAIKEHRPQVALLDHQMPGMDGAQVAPAVLQAGLPTGGFSGLFCEQELADHLGDIGHRHLAQGHGAAPATR